MPRKGEVLDDTPVAVPVRITKLQKDTDRIRNLIANQVSRMAVDQGFESFEESQDFDVGDDFDPDSPWEEQFDPEGKSSFDFISQEELDAREAGRPWPPSNNQGRSDGEEADTGENAPGSRKSGGNQRGTGRRKREIVEYYDDDGEDA